MEKGRLLILLTGQQVLLAAYRQTIRCINIFYQIMVYLPLNMNYTDLFLSDMQTYQYLPTEIKLIIALTNQIVQKLVCCLSTCLWIRKLTYMNVVGCITNSLFVDLFSRHSFSSWILIDLKTAILACVYLHLSRFANCN